MENINNVPTIGENEDSSKKNIKEKIGSTALSEKTKNESNSNIVENSEQSGKRKAERFINQHRREFSIFARDPSLNYITSPNAETFMFDAGSIQVIFPEQWFKEDDYSEEEKLFSSYHELSHFTDMRENPEVFLDNFAQMGRDADSLAKEWLKKHPNRAPQAAVASVYRKELHDLYNCLDDIYVNNIVYDRSPRFAKGSDDYEDVISLYKKLGFEEADLTNIPLHLQMSYSLLRDEMLGDVCGKSIVDDKVNDALSKVVLGQTIPEAVDSRLKPIPGTSLVDPKERYDFIRHFIQPQFIELLEEALEEALDEEPDRSQQNQQTKQQGQGEETEFDPFGDFRNNSRFRDFLDNDEENIEKSLHEWKEQKDIENMSDEERRKYEEEKRTKEFDDKHGITEEERKENTRLQNEIKEARNEMRKFWRNLVGKSVEYRKNKVKYQRKGRFNVSSYIDRYAETEERKAQGNLRTAEVYDRNEMKRTIVDQPETIDISLLVDCSVSMWGEKEEMAKQTAALLMYSIKDFNHELDRERYKTGSKLRANTQVIAFSSDDREIKGFERKNGRNAGANDTEIIKTFSKLDKFKRGGTNDEAPLQKIQSSLSADDLQRIKDKKLKKIIFEITDGASQYETGASRVIKQLAGEGVLTVGFQIGNVDEHERELFERIWNNDEAKQNGAKGIYIGNNLSDLPTKLMEELSDSLNDIII
ncbi:VWA domain-containing protein [Candidatus Saccharibacteria bacterium]|nr:VWA domain-containing protein [Candidatus Saccharibacteria bacterium]